LVRDIIRDSGRIIMRAGGLGREDIGHLTGTHRDDLLLAAAEFDRQDPDVRATTFIPVREDQESGLITGSLREGQ
jgi:hypothetical protein